MGKSALPADAIVRVYGEFEDETSTNWTPELTLLFTYFWHGDVRHFPVISGNAYGTTISWRSYSDSN